MRKITKIIKGHPITASLFAFCMICILFVLFLLLCELRGITPVFNEIDRKGPVIVFVAGLGEPWHETLTMTAQLFKNWNYAVFSWNQKQKILDWLKQNSRRRLILIGHSLGAGTAVRVANENASVTGLLITLDPVGPMPSFSNALSNIPWVNVRGCGRSWNDFVAGCGGRWKTLPNYCLNVRSMRDHNAPYHMLRDMGLLKVNAFLLKLQNPPKAKRGE